MDPDFNIYKDAVEKIPAEDKARLQGFLQGRAEADAEAHSELLERAEHLEREIERLQGEADGPD